MFENTPAFHHAHTEQPDLNCRREVITGGAAGVDHAIAVLLAKCGFKVFVCGRTAEHPEDAPGSVGKAGEGDGIEVDLTRPEGLELLFAAADGYLGGIDLATTNAAVPAGTISKTSEADPRYQIEAEFTAYLICAQQSTRRMKAGSDIVIVGSTLAVWRDGGNSICVAAKRGVEGFVAALRKELAEQGVKVGLIEPGFTGTDSQYPEFLPEKQRELIHAEQMLRAEDIAVAAHVDTAAPRRGFPDECRAPFAAHMIGTNGLSRACCGAWAGAI